MILAAIYVVNISMGADDDDDATLRAVHSRKKIDWDDVDEAGDTDNRLVRDAMDSIGDDDGTDDDGNDDRDDGLIVDDLDDDGDTEEEDIDTLFERLDALPTLEPIDVDNTTDSMATPSGEFHLDPLQVEVTTVLSIPAADGIGDMPADMFIEKQEEEEQPAKEEATTLRSDVTTRSGDADKQESDVDDSDAIQSTPASKVVTETDESRDTTVSPEIDKEIASEVTEPPSGDEATLQPTVEPRDFNYALEMSKSDDNVIILVVITHNYLAQALNFYVTSVLQHDLTNVLFIALDHVTCERMIAERRSNDIRCYAQKTDPNSMEEVSFGSKAFNRIVNVKANVAFRAMRLGYTVLVSDVDVAYVRNPLPYLKETCDKTSCDMLIQLHDPGYNSGFVYGRPTRSTMKIYQEAITIAAENKRLSDQVALNMAIRRISSQRRIRVGALDTKMFPVGKHFFLGMFCPPTERYDEVIAVHNNWIIGRDPKLMRARECLMWQYDGHDQYYTSERTRYITLAKALPYAQLTDGLINLFTLAAVLKRTPILPRFYIKSKKVTYPVWPLIRSAAGLHNFNNVTQTTGYRESSFLRNPRVPTKVAASLSRIYEVATEADKSTGHAYLLLPDLEAGPNVDTILAWFRGERRAVLRIIPILTRFKNLYYGKIVGQRLMGMFERMSKAKDLTLH